MSGGCSLAPFDRRPSRTTPTRWRPSLGAIWRRGQSVEQFALHPRLQAITLEIILRVAFGIDATDRLDDLRNCLRPFLRQARLSARPQPRLPSRAARPQPLGALPAAPLGRARGSRRGGRPTSERRRPRCAHRCPVAPAPSRERRRSPRRRRGTPQPAHDGSRRPRHNRDRARVDVRPPAASPGCDGSTARRPRRTAAATTSGQSSESPCG